MSQLAANPSVRRFVSDWTAPPKPVESVNVAREWFAPPKAPAPAFVSAPSAPVSAPEPQPVTPADLEAWRQRYPDARNIPDDQLAAALAEHRRNPSGTLQAPQPLTGAAGFGRNFGNQMGLALRSFPATSGLMTPEFGQQDFTERQPGEGVGGFVGSAVGSALRSAPALALGPAGGVVAIAPLVSEAAGQKMRSVQDQGGTIPQQVISGVGAGLTEAATEYIPIPFLKKLAEMPIKGAGRIGAKALQLLGIAAVEGSEEVASTIGQNVVDAADGVQTWEQAAQNIARDAPMAFAGGAIGGAAVSAPVLTAQSALNRRSIGAQSEPGVHPIEPGVSPEEKPIPGGFGKMSGPLPVNLPEPTPAPVEPQPVPEPSLDDVISEILAEREAVRTTVPTANPEPQPVGQVPLPEQAQGEGRGQPVVEQRVTGQEQAAPQPESLPDPSSMSMKALREELKNAGVAKPPSKKSELVTAVEGLRASNSERPVDGDPSDDGGVVSLGDGVSGVVETGGQAPASAILEGVENEAVEPAEAAPLQSPEEAAEEYEYVEEESTVESLGIAPALAEAIPEQGAALEETDAGRYDLVFSRPVTLAEGRKLKSAGWVRDTVNKGRYFYENPGASPSVSAESGGAINDQGAVTTAEPPATASPQTGRTVGRESDYTIENARYAKGQKAVRAPSDDGFKTRAGRLAGDGLKGRWSNRERAYIMSPTKAAKFERLYNDGWDASFVDGELKPPPIQGEASPSIADKLSDIESSARKRRQSRKINRGKNVGASTLPGDAVDFIIETAAGAAKDLVLTASAIRQLVVEKIPEHLRPYLKEIQRRVVRLVQTSLNEEGTAVSPKAFRENYRSAVAPEPSNTRVARLKEYSAGSRGVIKGLQDVIRRAKKVGGKDEAARSLAIRKEVAKLVRENMPPQYRGALLSEVAKAKDLKGIARAIGRMESVLLRGETRRLAGNIKKRTGKKRLKKFTQERRDRLREIRAEAESLARGLRQDVPVKGGAVASAAGSTASTKPRRKAAPLKDVRAAHSRMRDISEEALTIAADQRNEREIEVLGRKQEVAQLVSEAKAGLAKRKPLPPGDTPEATEASRRQRWVRALLTPDSLARTLDSDFNGGGVFHRLMVQAFRSAHNDKLAQMHGHYDKIDALAKDAGFNGIGDAARQLSGSLGKQDVKYVPVQVGEYDKIPLSAAMHLYAMDPQSRDRFINGTANGNFADEKKGKPFLLTAKSFADAEAALTDGQKRFVDGVKAIIESRSADLFAVHRRLKGYDPEKVKDYFPIRLNRDVVPSVPEDWKQHATRFLENAGLLKARERSSGEIPMLVGDFLGMALNHLESVENIIHLAEPTRNAHMVLRDTGVQRAVAERFGESADKRIKQIITDASGTNEPNYDKVERFASKLTSNVSRSLTAANPSSWARQLGGLASLKTKMDAPTYAAGLKALSTAPASTARRMAQHPYFRQRYGENPSSRYSGVKEEGGTSSVPTRIILGAVGRAIAAGKPIDAAWRIAPKLFDKIRIANYFDMVSSIVAYGGFEAEARAAHPDWSDSKVAKYAGDRASEVVRETQNTHDLTDSNALMSYAAQNVWLKPFLAFTSDQSKQFNNLYQAYASGDTKRMMNTGIATAMNIVWGALVSAGSVGLVGEVVSVLTGRHGDDEERRRKAAEAAAWTFLRDSLGTAFPADRLVEAVRGWTAGGDSGLIDAPVAAVFDNINRAGKSVTDAVSMLTDEAQKQPGREAARQKKIVGKFTSALGDIAIGGSMAIGAPFPPIYYQAKRVLKSFEEKKKPVRTRPQRPSRPQRPNRIGYREVIESITPRPGYGDAMRSAVA